jgi:hypothetical protein
MSKFSTAAVEISTESRFLPGLPVPSRTAIVQAATRKFRYKPIRRKN